MTGDLNIVSVAIGAIAFLAGLAMLAVAIRNRGDSEDVKSTAMLIAGMMLTAFGLLLAGFAIGFAASEPPQFRAEAPR